MFSYAYDFTPDVEQTSIDEGYFDLSATRKSPVEIALTIRKAIGQKLKITVSEGIGTNKLVSAVASKLNKPAAFEEVSPGGEAAFLHPLANKWLPGIGPKMSLRLNAAGLALIRHIATTPLDMLGLLLGNQAASIQQFAHGIDERPLIPVREPQKSFSQNKPHSLLRQHLCDGPANSPACAGDDCHFVCQIQIHSHSSENLKKSGQDFVDFFTKPGRRNSHERDRSRRHQTRQNRIHAFGQWAVQIKFHPGQNATAPAVESTCANRSSF
jgi:hypothetical protein